MESPASWRLPASTSLCATKPTWCRRPSGATPCLCSMSRFLRSICHLLSKEGWLAGKGMGLICDWQRHFSPFLGGGLGRDQVTEIRSDPDAGEAACAKLHTPVYAILCSCLFWRDEGNKAKAGCHFLIFFFPAPCTQPAASARAAADPGEQNQHARL